MPAQMLPERDHWTRFDSSQAIYVGRDLSWPQTQHETNSTLAALHSLGVEVITVRQVAGRRMCSPLLLGSPRIACLKQSECGAPSHSRKPLSRRVFGAWRSGVGSSSTHGPRVSSTFSCFSGARRAFLLLLARDRPFACAMSSWCQPFHVLHSKLILNRPWEQVLGHEPERAGGFHSGLPVAHARGHPHRHFGRCAQPPRSPDGPPDGASSAPSEERARCFHSPVSLPSGRARPFSDSSND